jgi:CheY-like chemotaxis protein
MNFTWIDDFSSRKRTSDALEERLGVNINFISVQGEDWDDLLHKLLKGAQPDLIIIDHNLDRVIKSNSFRSGFTSAALIRETWPACPIICITGISNTDQKRPEHFLYDATIEISSVSDYDPIIFSIANSFKKIKRSRFRSTTPLLKLFGVPNEETLRFVSVLPQDVKESLAKPGLAVSLCRWTRGTFFMRPGFLYDRLWVSTMLGLTEKGFKKVEDLFEPAVYDGLFANEADKRWWKIKVIDILAKNVKGSGLPWHKGRQLPGILKNDYSVDRAKGLDYPEVVAYADETQGAKRYAARIQETIPHPDFSDLLYFDTIRMIKPDDED